MTDGKGPPREAQMGTDAGRHSCAVTIRCLFPVGGCAQCPGAALKCPCMASWRPWDSPCSLIQKMVILLSHSLPWSFPLRSFTNRNQWPQWMEHLSKAHTHVSDAVSECVNSGLLENRTSSNF